MRQTRSGSNIKTGFINKNLRSFQRKCKHKNAITPTFGDWYCPTCHLKRKKRLRK